MMLEKQMRVRWMRIVNSKLRNLGFYVQAVKMWGLETDVTKGLSNKSNPAYLEEKDIDRRRPGQELPALFQDKQRHQQKAGPRDKTYGNGKVHRTNK